MSVINKANYEFICKPVSAPGELSARFLADNPPFGIRPLKQPLPNNDLIPEKLFAAEQTKQQINRYCRRLQALLYLLPEFPDAEVPDKVVDYYLKATGDLIYILFHLGDYAGNTIKRGNNYGK